MFRGILRTNRVGIRNYATVKADKKIYELRTYNINPKDTPQFSRLTNEWIHLRTSASPLLGYWMTELGGINQAVHIWEYENLAQRQAVRVGLSSNPEWIGNYLSVASKMWSSQTNVALISILEPQKPPSPGVYELRKSQTVPSEKEKFERQPTPGGPFLVAVWKTVVGDVPGSYELWQYPTLDDVIKTPARHSSKSFQSKVLLPTAFSPLK